MGRRIILFFFFFISAYAVAYGQEPYVKKDSSKVYRNIEEYSKKGKFTQLIYGLIFKPVSEKENKGKKKYVQLLRKSYKPFEGKIIRHIHIVTCDPFGYSLSDTAVAAQNVITKAGNSLHIKTQNITIRNLLLVHKNEPFDSLLVNESERLVRSQKFVREVSFRAAATAKYSDSVDIFIRVIDLWSIIPDGGLSTTNVSGGITESNFLGFGHEIKGYMNLNHSKGDYKINSNYYIPNIRNTYINSNLHYDIDNFGNSLKSLAVDRPFYSPFAIWAGGVSFKQQFRIDSINTPAGYIKQDLRFNAQDYWAGISQTLSKGKTVDERTTNLILAGRLLRTNFLQKPDEILDPLHMYADQLFFLSSIGISGRKYVRDKYIFNFGFVEDVPIGKVYSITGGYQVRDDIGRLYLGGKVSWGHYTNWGYLSAAAEYGTFLHNAHNEQGVFTTGLNYFTDLFEIGRWKFRQFIKPQYTSGINRLSYETLTINEENGIRGFGSPTLVGTQKLLLTLQTQSYAPWNVIGFQFGPYFTYSAAMIGNESSGFHNSRIFSQIGFGFLIRNEYLIFNIFQISVAFYPSIPGDGNNVIKIDPNKTSDIGFRDFSIGKPSIVPFQ